MQFSSEPVVLNSMIKLGRNHAMKYTHTHATLNSKHNDLLSLKRSYLVLNEQKKTRRQEKKANKIITLDGKNSKKVEL